MTTKTRLLTAAVGAMAAATTLSAPAHADPIDDAFLGALRNAGINYNNPVSTVELGRSVCPMLVEPGKSVAGVASRMGATNGLSPDMASFFTGIAISMYCPSMMSSIGNGTFLNWLGAPGLPR